MPRGFHWCLFATRAHNGRNKSLGGLDLADGLSPVRIKHFRQKLSLMNVDVTLLVCFQSHDRLPPSSRPPPLTSVLRTTLHSPWFQDQLEPHRGKTLDGYRQMENSALCPKHANRIRTSVFSCLGIMSRWESGAVLSARFSARTFLVQLKVP